MARENKIYILAIAFALASVLLLAFVILPMLDSIKTDSQKIISVKNENEKIKVQLSEIKVFQNDYSLLYKPVLDKVDALFVNPNDPVDFIKFLETAASKSGLTLKISLQQQPLLNRDTALFYMSVSGQFNSVQDFMKNIEFGPYMVEITDVNIQNQIKISASDSAKLTNEQYDTRKVDAQISIKIFLSKK